MVLVFLFLTLGYLHVCTYYYANCVNQIQAKTPAERILGHKDAGMPSHAT